MSFEGILSKVGWEIDCFEDDEDYSEQFDWGMVVGEQQKQVKQQSFWNLRELWVHFVQSYWSCLEDRRMLSLIHI